MCLEFCGISVARRLLLKTGSSRGISIEWVMGTYMSSHNLLNLSLQFKTSSTLPTSQKSSFKSALERAQKNDYDFSGVVLGVIALSTN